MPFPKWERGVATDRVCENCELGGDACLRGGPDRGTGLPRQ